MNGEVFLDFVRKSLLPISIPFDGLNTHSVVDNLMLQLIMWIVWYLKYGSTGQILACILTRHEPIEVFSEVKQYMQANGNLFQATSA